MKREFKQLLFLFVVASFFLTCFISPVKAMSESEENVISGDVLNNYSNTVKFSQDNHAVTYGSLRDRLTVSMFLSGVDVDGLKRDFNVSDVYVEANDNSVLAGDGVIVSGMKLVIKTSSDSYSYDIMVVGDVNGDGIVNNHDVNFMADNILAGGGASIFNDLNSDGVFDVLDVTHAIYSITNGIWNDTVSASDTLYSKLTNNSEVYVGDEVLVKYSISGFHTDSINGLEGILNYDKSMLSFEGASIDNQYGDINADGKFLYILDNYQGGDAIITFKFKALASGNSRISINNIKGAYNGALLNVDDSSIFTDIKINQYGTGGDGFDDKIDDNKKNDDSVREDVVVDTGDNGNTNTSKVKNTSNRVVSLVPVISNSVTYKDSVTYVKISSNNYIDSLKIKGYDINFDKNVFEYSINVGSGVNSLDISVITSSNVASYEIVGNKKFKTGKNVVSIIVTAEDGSTRAYKINVNKDSAGTYKKGQSDKKDSGSNSSRVVIIVLIVLVIIGLIYVIFKDDEEEEAMLRSNNKKEK